MTIQDISTCSANLIIFSPCFHLWLKQAVAMETTNALRFFGILLSFRVYVISNCASFFIFISLSSVWVIRARVLPEKLLDF